MFRFNAPDCPPLEVNPDYSKVSPLVKTKTARLLSEGKSPLYFYGDIGTGKTFAAAAIFELWPENQKIYQEGHEIGTRGGDPVFEVASRLTKRLAMIEYHEQQREFTRIRKADLFVLDDIARKKMTEAQIEILIDIVELREGLPTIYVSNISPNKLSAAIGDARAASRMLAGMNFVEFIGNDRRLSQ